MSHFSTMPALFGNKALLLEALVLLGVSPENIWEDVNGRHMNTVFSDKGKPCQIGISLAGMSQLSDSNITTNASVRGSGSDKYLNFTRPSGSGERAEIGFYWDDDAQGYRVQTDSWEVGNAFTSVFSMAYQVAAAESEGLVVTGVEYTQSGDIQLTCHKAVAAQKTVEATAVRL